MSDHLEPNNHRKPPRVVKQHAELVQVGKRSASILGFRNDLLEEHLSQHLTQISNKWCSVDCAARVMFGRASELNRAGIRRRIAGTFKVLLARRRFLVIEYDDTRSGHGKIKAFKLFESGNGIEGEYVLNQIERMTLRQQMTEQMRVQAMVAIGCPPPSTPEEKGN